MEKCKEISFGKIDYNKTGRKAYPVTLELSLRDWNYPNEFTVCGNVYNTRSTDIVRGGQCLDELLPYFKSNKKFKEIYELWKNYHLKQITGEVLARVEELLAS